ncbi:response regulator [Proteinivorax tanatarense]|uniref:Stage 0 sporulation protein A homolog n=1 Tax=Proteinivorax tanatarense TaxID=1260629 RepID=A0AAU7VMJ0_9FIRM
MKILVVDDQKLNLMLAKEMLTEHFSEHEVLLCNDSTKVKDMVFEQKIDIILLDIVMPKLSGIDILAELKGYKEKENIQIIMLTAKDDDKTFKTCFELGANDYIIKPIKSVEFQARLKTAIKDRTNTLKEKKLLKDIKRQNQELQKINDKLKETQFYLIQSEKMAAIGELAAGVAHEINNPIGYISSNMETLDAYTKKLREYYFFARQRLEQAQQIDMLEQIKDKDNQLNIEYVLNDLPELLQDSKEGVDRVSEIVSSLRNFARTGREDEKGYTSVDEIIAQVLLIVRNEAKFIAQVEYQGNQDVEIWCNKGQISQVLLNIILNAIFAIKKQERKDLGKINIAVENEKKYVSIKVSDDGPGIEQKIINKIFDPFFTTKDVGEGTGLGLSISYDIIINKHKGKIDVATDINKGTTFIVKLPKGK